MHLKTLNLPKADARGNRGEELKHWIVEPHEVIKEEAKKLSEFKGDTTQKIMELTNWPMWLQKKQQQKAAIEETRTIENMNDKLIKEID